MLDSLSRIEQQLLVAGQRDINRRHARRRIALPSAVVAGLLIISGSSAVAGVGPVADLIDGQRVIPGYIDPKPQDARDTITRASANGAPQSALVFRRDDGGYCVQAPPALDRTTSSGSCAPQQAVADQLAAGKAFVVTGTSTGSEPQTLVAGIVPADTTAVTVTAEGDATPQDASVGRIWTNANSTDSATPAARSFLAVLGPDVNPSTLTIAVDGAEGQHTTKLPTDLLTP